MRIVLLLPAVGLLLTVGCDQNTVPKALTAEDARQALLNKMRSSPNEHPFSDQQAATSLQAAAVEFIDPPRTVYISQFQIDLNEQTYVYPLPSPPSKKPEAWGHTIRYKGRFFRAADGHWEAESPNPFHEWRGLN